MAILPLLVAVAGPTGSGKSDLAISLSRSLDGEVINCDSLQVFKFFDIGTAKLPESAWEGVPHHLIDCAEPTDLFTAGDFARLAREEAARIVARHRVPVVAGGTGFYLRAMLQGLSPGPARDENLRMELQKRELRRPGFLHRLLRRLDPPSARRIHAHDEPKLIRALEISLRGGTAASAQPSRAPLTGYRICQIGIFPPREQLYARLNQRCEAMFAGGLIEECESILKRGIPRSAKPFESIGYAQALEVIDGRMTRDEALADTQLRTRQYAKRQLTWFRRENLARIEGFGFAPATQRAALALIGQNAASPP